MMFISFAGVMTCLLGISGFVMFSGLMMVFGRFLMIFNYPVIRLFILTRKLLQRLTVDAQSCDR
jgi:hypothetical protein